MGTQTSKKEETDDSSESTSADKPPPDPSYDLLPPPLHNTDASPSPFTMSPLSKTRTKPEDSAKDSDSNIPMPAVFQWHHGGHRVYVMGSYDNWTSKREMHRSHNDFTLILEVTPGEHEYSFEVDSIRRLDPDKETRRNAEGVIHNVLVVKSPFEMGDRDPVDSKPYSQELPDFGEYIKEPPNLPPHLNYILLNNQPTQRYVDPLTLPVPQHVTVNHFYMAEQKEKDLMVLGITQRYKTKFVTTVYYKPILEKRKSEIDEKKQDDIDGESNTNHQHDLLK